MFPLIATLELLNKKRRCDLGSPVDISMPLSPSSDSASAWYVEPMKIEIVRSGKFIGSVAEGGSTNFRNIIFNPHGNGTHTECVGHIANEVYSIHQCLRSFFFHALLISVQPEKVQNDDELSQKGDFVISKSQILQALNGRSTQAIVIRTLPNHTEKLHINYSNSNPPYLHPDAAAFLAKSGVEHLLIDLPSVDREEDQGKLLAHHAWWEHPHNTQFQRTITELIYVPDTVPDGEYLLNLMIASFENDASPSKPVLYPILNDKPV